MSNAWKVITAAVALTVVIGTAAVLARRSAGMQAPTAGSSAREARAPSPTNDSHGLAQSSDKVRTRVQRIDANPSAIVVRLDIAPGWHVNANPASLGFLVPTEVTVSVSGDLLPIIVDYPPGHDSGIRLENRPIMVYGDGTIIRLNFREGADNIRRAQGPVDVATRVQACSDNGICIAPSTLHDRLPSSSR